MTNIRVGYILKKKSDFRPICRVVLGDFLMEDIKTLRKQTGFTQREFSDKYDIPMSTLQHWEQGINTPPKYVVTLLEQLIANKNAQVKDINQ